ncbi:hypothetical protein [Flavobacterium cerinum]|uniref:Cytochrome c domain-containing protein n=1 Tax=Flavobacterium cerinum TaxID=2502784 RepID=A0ABY5IR20_9FLAO|nr:hypothetical protein [Flavobacterium cerinum]UUC43834.1 hypothetical protein NOX80_09335 [Flavobacterium cerinum]
MRSSKPIVIGLLLIAIGIAYLGRQYHRPITNNYQFPNRLSELRLFKGSLQDLIPNDSIEQLELNSTLFTDHAEKQRLLRLPKGTKLKNVDGGLPQFPEESLLAKTFYYEGQIIETRVLYLKNEQWNAATYQWNATQTEAYLISKGATVAVKRKNKATIHYTIPSEAECTACHRHNGTLQPIGPKIRNLNRMVIRNGETVSQLDYLHRKQRITKQSINTKLPDYNDPTESLEKRARAYMDINCAHCHNPSGMAGFKNLYLAYEIPYKKTGIARQRLNILFRMETSGELHMPKLGTTITDPNGLALIKTYIKSLDQLKKS